MMKRTLYRYARPFKGGMREGFLLRLRDGGREGWGEIAPLPGFSNESLDEAYDDFLTKSYSLPSVQFGCQCALFDLLDPIDVDSIRIKIKTKVGHLSVEEALRSVVLVPGMRIDVNRKWTLEGALTFAKEFHEVEYFEEPLLPGEDARGFPYPVALDESLREREQPPYPNVVAHVIKPTMHGYPLPKVEKGIDFILSSSYETELGIYQIAKLSYRLKIPQIPMGLGTCHFFEDALFEEAPKLVNDRLHFPKEWKLKTEKVQVILDECV